MLDLDAQASTPVVMMGYPSWRSAREHQRITSGLLGQMITEDAINCKDYISQGVGYVVLAVEIMCARHNVECRGLAVDRRPRGIIGPVSGRYAGLGVAIPAASRSVGLPGETGYSCFEVRFGAAACRRAYRLLAECDQWAYLGRAP